MLQSARLFRLTAALAVLALAGCATLVTFGEPASGATSKELRTGETGAVTGLLAKQKTEFVLTEEETGIVYRFVGLGKSGEAALAPYVGKTVTVKLTVRSTESAKARNAAFVSIVP